MWSKGNFIFLSCIELSSPAAHMWPAQSVPRLLPGIGKRHLNHINGGKMKYMDGIIDLN